MRRLVSLAAVSALGISTLIGCSHQQPVTMAPPMNQNSGYSNAQPPVGNMAPQGNMAGNMNPAGGNVFQWQDVPANQQVPIVRATFDQGGYQIFAQSGETIVVPFVNNNLYAMKFGRSNNGNYFVNENGVPTLYLMPGQGLENAAAQGAMWYPIPQNYNYTQPMYVALAPSWNDYTSMGWYPGMTYYGGMWGYTPYSHTWMPGFYISIGGHRYTDYGGYHSYYMSTPGYIRNRVVYNSYYSTPRGRSFTSTGTGSFNRTSSGSTGSFRSGRFGGSTGSTGSFGTRRTMGSSTFGNSATGSTGSFGTRRTGSGFGGSTPSTGSGFGNRVPSLGGRNTGSSFGGGSTPRATGSSFGGGSTGTTTTPRSTGSSFGGGSTRTSGSSFGGGGGRSFGGGSRRR